MINIDKNQEVLFVLGKSKDILIKAFENDINIPSIILGEGNTSTVLRNINVYDTLTIDLTQNTAKTYVTMDTIVSGIENDKIKSVDLIINVFSHLDLMSLSETEQKKYYTYGLYGNRVDCLLDLVTRLILYDEELRRKIGVSKINMKQSRPISIIQPSTSFYGKQITFTVFDR